MTVSERNLVIVHTPPLQARTDFEAIQTIMAERAPDIEVFIANNVNRNSVTRRVAAGRPSVVFAPIALREFRPARGKVFAGVVESTKKEELTRLSAAGVRVPRWVVLEPGTRLDPTTWGAFTVVKPNTGRQGLGVRLWRTKDVRWIDPLSWPRDDPRHGRELMAQQFVDTGTRTTNFRVMTVFGRVVYSTCNRLKEPRPFVLHAAGNEPFDQPISATSSGRSITLNDDPDILAVACEAAGVFPEVPALGVDIIREEATGLLYVLEVNLRGGVWHMSSRYWANNRREFGLDLYAQFGALDIIADALIDVTRREAI